MPDFWGFFEMLIELVSFKVLAKFLYYAERPVLNRLSDLV